MYRNDYILRQIELFAIFAQRIAQLFQLGQLDMVEGDLDKTSRHFTGLNFSLIQDMDSEMILQMLQTGDSLEFHKLYVLGVLFQEDARLASLRGNEVRAFQNRITAMELLFPIYDETESDNALRVLAIERIDAISTDLADYNLSEELCTRLALIYEKEGRLAKAEDFLHQHLKESPAFREVTGAFYRRLLELPDSVLEEATLPRAEIEEELQKLERAPLSQR